MNFIEAEGEDRFNSQNLTKTSAQPEKSPEMPLSIETYPTTINEC